MITNLHENNTLMYEEQNDKVKSYKNLIIIFK